MGHRYSSTRIGIDSGQLQLEAETDIQSRSHDHHFPNMSDCKSHGPFMNFPQSTKQHYRSHSDISDLASTPTRTLTEFGPSQETNGQPQEKTAHSESKMDAIEFYYNESLRAAAIFAADPRRRSDLDQREYRKLPRKTIPASPRLVSMGASESSSDTRDNIVRGSSHNESERPRDITKTNTARLLGDGHHHSYSKKFQRPLDKRVDGRRKAADLPRSPSIFGRYEPKELVHWKEGLRSSSPPRKSFTKEMDPQNVSDGSAKSFRRFSGNSEGVVSRHILPEGRVEVKKESPHVRSMPRDRCTFASIGPHKHVLASPDSNSIHKDCSFKESPGAADFRESLRPFLAGAEEDRWGLDQSHNSNEKNLIGFPHQICDHEQILVSKVNSKEHRKVSSIVGRLMGLEEIPSSNQQVKVSLPKVPDASSRGDKFFRGLVQFDPRVQKIKSSSPPPPCRPKKYVVQSLQPPSEYYRQGACHQHNYPAQYKIEERLCGCCCEEDRDYEHPTTNSFNPCEQEDQDWSVHHADPRQQEENHGSSSPQLEDPNIQDLNASVAPKTLMKRSDHKKKTFWKILEAMRPRTLLKISRRKQSKGEKLPSDKTIAGEVQLIPELDLGQHQQTDVIQASKLSTSAKNQEHLFYPNSVSQKQDQLTENCDNNGLNMAERARFQSEDDILMMRAIGNAGSQVAKTGTFQVRHVKTTSSTSNDKEACSAISAESVRRRATKPEKSREVVATTTRNAHSGSTLETDCETDPSSATQNGKPEKVHESRKMRTTLRQHNQSSKNPSPHTRRKQEIRSPHDGRPLFPRNSFSRDFRDADEIGRKPLARGQKDSRALYPAHPKAQLPRRDTLMRRSTARVNLKDKPASVNDEKSITKETISVQSKLKQSNGVEPPAPRERSSVNGSSTAEAATLNTSDNSDLPLSGTAPGHFSDSKPGLEISPKPGRLKEPIVYIRRSPPAIQRIENASIIDHDRDSSTGPSQPGACVPVQANPRLLSQEVETLAIEELTPPRGDILKNVQLDDNQTGGLDRPSPISVLHNSALEDQLTPSPSSPKQSTPLLQDSVNVHRDDQCYGARDSEDCLQSNDASAWIEANVNFDELFSKCAAGLKAQSENTATENLLCKFQSYFRTAGPDKEKIFTESFMTSSQGGADCGSQCVSANSLTKQSSYEFTDTKICSGNLLQCLQSNEVLQGHDPILLLDCLEEIMDRILESQSNLMLYTGFPHETVYPKPKGKQLVEKLWIELHDIERAPPLEDVCDTVHRLLHKDLLRNQGQQWSNYNAEWETIGVDMEGMILGDLMEDAVRDLRALLPPNPFHNLPIEAATRRQLFAF